MVTIDERTLARLVSAYERGYLVPFLGAGVSTPHCALWPEFIANLERQARLGTPARSTGISSTTLVQRAGRAVRKLHHNSRVPFATAIQRAVRSTSKKRRPAWPRTAKALARIRWPLVITTNYDDWFVTAWNMEFVDVEHQRQTIERMEICGRAPSDCERVLNSLRAPDNPLLWAIQGFVGGQAPRTRWTTVLPPGDRMDLANQLVVGHAEYRREAYRSLSFRRAFSEIFRSRSLFFIGSGLSESYFDSLFDEVLELQGAVPHMHYALIERGSLDPKFLRERFQIEAIEYDRHGEVPRWLGGFRAAIAERRNRLTSWGVGTSERRTPHGAGSDLQIVHGPLPNPASGECLLISAGMGDGLRLSAAGERAVATHFPRFSHRHARLPGEPKMWRFDGVPVFAVAARNPGYTGPGRDARIVAQAMQRALQVAEKQGFTTMHTTLLAAGRRRVFAPHVALMQMIRGYAKWRREHPDRELRLSINVVDESCLLMLSSGRLNLTELLEIDEIRFWIEIWKARERGAAELTRFLRFDHPDTPIDRILAAYDLPRTGFRVEIIPSPIRDPKQFGAAEVRRGHSPPWTLASAGIMPGSTLRIVPDSWRR